MLINTTLTEALIKNYDILTKYILNSNKSQNTKRTLLNNILIKLLVIKLWDLGEGFKIIGT